MPVRGLFDTMPARALARKDRPHGPLSLADLVAARRTAARLIMALGDDGLFIVPMFQRLDGEVTAARERESVIGRVREIAGGGG